jgi:hypothetical protein
MKKKVEQVIADLIKKTLNEFIQYHHNPIVAEKNKRIAELEVDLETEKASAQRWFDMYHDEVRELRIKLEKVSRLGARMASALYNVRQPGFHVNDYDREVMGELVKEWDHRGGVK